MPHRGWPTCRWPLPYVTGRAAAATESPATVAEAAANLLEAALDTTTGTSAESVAIAAAAVGIAADAVAAANLDTAITIQPLMVASAAWMAPRHPP